MFGRGDHLVVAAADSQAERLDVLLLGGLLIGAPIVHYGPFVMNTRAEIIQAVEDYQAGRLGAIPADQLEAPELRMSRPATSRPGTNPESTAAVTELFDAAGPFPIDLGGSVAGGRMLPRPERDR